MAVPAAKDLVTILYRPRETFRRILDSGTTRWTAALIVLAQICQSVGDRDMSGLQKVLPGFPLHATLATAALLIILQAIVFACFAYAFSWMTAVAGRFIGGEAPSRDVTAAVAWGLVPLIWSVLYRIPLAVYREQFHLERLTREHQMLIVGDFIQAGGCSLAVLVMAVQLVVAGAVVYVTSSCVGEAMRFSTWKGLGSLTMAAAAPLVIVIAAVLATHT